MQPLPPAPPFTSEVERFDVTSGAVLAQRTLSLADSNVQEIVHHEGSRRLFLRGASVIALDEVTLQEVNRIGPPLPASPAIAVDPDFPHLYVAWWSGSAGSFRAIFQQLDASTLEVLAQGELMRPPVSWGCSSGLASRRRRA